MCVAQNIARCCMVPFVSRGHFIINLGKENGMCWIELAENFDSQSSIKLSAMKKPLDVSNVTFLEQFHIRASITSYRYSMQHLSTILTTEVEYKIRTFFPQMCVFHRGG